MSTVHPSINHSGACSGLLRTCVNALAMGRCRLLNCLSQKLGSLSGLGDFQFAALVTFDLSSCTVNSSHTIWMRPVSSCSCSLIYWACLLCSTSCYRMSCQNCLVSWQSAGFSIWIFFFPSSLYNVLASSLNILFWWYCSFHLVYPFNLWAFACNLCLRPSWQIISCSLVIPSYLLFSSVFFWCWLSCCQLYMQW